MKKPKSSDKKKLIIEFTVILVCGIFCLGLGLGLLFGLYRPFVPWQKFRCTFEEGTLEFLEGDFNTLYRYVIDGQEYEVKVKNFATGGGGGTAVWEVEKIYVNKNNPYDVKLGVYGEFFLVMTLLFVIAGIGMVSFDVRTYYKKREKNKKGN